MAPHTETCPTLCLKFTFRAQVIPGPLEVGRGCCDIPLSGWRKPAAGRGHLSGPRGSHHLACPLEGAGAGAVPHPAVDSLAWVVDPTAPTQRGLHVQVLSGPWAVAGTGGGGAPRSYGARGGEGTPCWKPTGPSCLWPPSGLGPASL